MGLGDLSVTKSIFGDGSSPGVMGTGQQRFNQPSLGQPKRNPDGSIKYKMPTDSQRAEDYLFGKDPGDIEYEEDPYKAWQDPQAEARRAQLNSQTTKYEGRKLEGDARIDRGQIERFSGTSIPDAERFAGTRVGQFERGKAAQLSPAERIEAERVGGINIGNASTFGGAQIDPAAQARAAQLGRQDAEFRSGQTGLMRDLQEQSAGRGPSLAAGQLREATDRNLAQQQAAAAASGSPLAQRNLQNQATVANQQVARDAAQMRIQEQLAARQQLQGVTQTGREQDINVANAQAQLQQQTALANQAAINARAGQQAGLNQQAGIFSAEQLNQRQFQQAQLNAQLALANQQAGMQANLANQQYGNQFALQQGQFGQQMNLANMQAYNERQALQAQLYQQAGLANQQQANQFTLQQGAWAQQAGLANQQYSNQALFANQQAALQNQQMNDAMTRYFTEAGLGLDARQQQAMMAYQALQSQQALGYAGLEQKSYEGAREGIGGMMGGVGGAIGALAMFSDEEVKGSVTRGNDQIKDFLDTFMKQGAAQTQQNLAGEEKKSSGGGLMGGMASGMSSGAAMSAMSDQKAKDLGAENSMLKAQMAGMAMNQGSHGKGFFGGLGSGMASGAQAKMAQDKANSASAIKRPDPSAGNTTVLNNPNAAVAVPGGFQGSQAMAPSYGGLGVRENPYGAGPAPQTWGAPPPEPAMLPPATMPAGMSNMNNPYGPPLQTWGVPNTMSSSPVQAKTGISSGDMQIANFLASLKGNNDEYTGPQSGASTGGAGMQTGGMGMMGAGMMQNGGMGVSSYSDKMSKERIRSVMNEKLEEFLNTVHPYEYSYKQPEMPGRGYGRFVSPMAQELEDTELGKSAVIQTPNGKMVDYGKLGGVMLAAQAYLNERLNDLEAKKGKK
jgi:hypothetical protein